MFVGQPVALGHGANSEAATTNHQVAHQFGGLAAPLLGDPVIAHGGQDRFVAHQFLENIRWRSDVGVPLGIGVPERVGADAGPVIGHRIPVRINLR